MFGNAKYSILKFVHILEEVLELDKKHADEEYFVDSVSLTSLDEKTQKEIGEALQQLVDDNRLLYDVDESSSWLKNIIDFCNSRNIKLGQSIINSINLNYEKFAINEHNLITLENKVLHTTLYKGDASEILVASMYGIFSYTNKQIRPLRSGIEGFRWMIY